MFRRKIKTEKGAAMIIAVIFFIFISLAIIAGLSTSSVLGFNVVSTDLIAKNAYFLAESGIEDATYRIITNKPIADTMYVIYGSNRATTNVTTVGNGKVITSAGEVSKHYRNVQTMLENGSGVSFNYGMQAGMRGIVLSGGTINGNIYANGPITGDKSSAITGTAISSTNISLIEDTGNTNGPQDPDDNYDFGNGTLTQDVGEVFKISRIDLPLAKISLYIKKIGSPEDATLRIINSDEREIGSAVLHSSLVSTDYGWVDITFDEPISLSGLKSQYLTLLIDTNADDDDGFSDSNYYNIAITNDYNYDVEGVNAYLGSFPSYWHKSVAGDDIYFSTFLQSSIETGLISGESKNSMLQIGTVSGSAQAHTVNYVNEKNGLIYCKNGTENSMACKDQTDPPYIDLPILNKQIALWKIEAGSLGVYKGDYKVDSKNDTLGPKEITGDLTINGNSTLTVAGTLYVHGNIYLTGGAKIALSPSYGGNDGVVISDGVINITGGSATGSGNSKSYIMLLSTYKSPNNTPAINLTGGSGVAILYASNGIINVSGNSSAKEIDGDGITIKNGAVNYEIGIANSSFTSGPSGGLEISSWKEIK